MACALSALTVSVVPAAAHAGAGFDRVERRVLHRINVIRVHHGLARLRANRALARSADFHCADMLHADFFAHTSSNGQSFAQRVEAFRPSRRIGETLAWVSGTPPRRQASRIVSMWMASPPHRASLLSPSFRRVGIARRTGQLDGVRAVVFTADFASRR